MAIKTGRVGKVLIEATQIGNLDNGSLALDFGNQETTPVGADWADLVALVRRATLTLTCSYDPADTATGLVRTEYINGDGYMSAIQIWEDTSHYFSFSGAMVTVCNINKTSGAVDKINITLRAKGAVSYT